MGQRGTHDGLTVQAHQGEGAALLAFDVDPALAPELAGFAIERVTPEGDHRILSNRLTFHDPIVADTTPEQRRAITTPSDEAPFQTFHWVDFPRRVAPGDFTYRVTAMLFDAGSEDTIQPGPQVEVELDLRAQPHAQFQLGFTRGYVSSQAYADLFHNAPLVPDPQTLDYDTKPFADQYRWLGFAASQMVFGLLKETLADPHLSLDVFAYDLDEPAIVADLVALGPRLRLFLDDSDSHVISSEHKEQPLEPEAHARIAAAGGAVKLGHFTSLSHSKVLIQRRGGTPVKVLAGSANFSVRGLYVQSNNVFVFDDEEVAGRYAQAFEQAWTQPLADFDESPIAAGWLERAAKDLPACALCFSPHRKQEVSLQRVADAIASAKESVLFSIMEIGNAKGLVMDQILGLPQRKELYAYGTTQRLDGALKVTKGTIDSPFVPFGYLQDKVPPPFQEEYSGGGGMVIHHKFVVCDFNGEQPVAFAGSSNLAGRAETANGDNLVAFADRDVATAFAVEAIQLLDHYRFRAVQSQATDQQPLRLKRRSEAWTREAFDPASPRSKERELLAREPSTAPAPL